MSNFSGYQLNQKVTIPLIKKYEEKRTALKKAIKNPNISLGEKLKLVGELHNLPKKSSKTRLRSRCSFSYKTGSVDKMTGLNYFQIRRMASNGELPGYKKASW